MNKRFVISWLVLTVVSFLFGFLVHGLLLADHYSALVPNMFRSPEDSQKVFHFMILANVLFSFGFTWIYRKGFEPGKPVIGQGIRFGLAVAALSIIPRYLIYYTVQPTPGNLVAGQIAFDTIAIVILGIIAAMLNRNP
jgi:hypothetical protein